jgi:hypothetical protein
MKENGRKPVKTSSHPNRLLTEARPAAASPNAPVTDGFPVYWKPDAEALEALGSLLGLMEGRE